MNALSGPRYADFLTEQWAGMTASRFASWATTHPGSVRRHNEDALVDRPDLGLWAVADGAGGHAHGDVASRMVANALEALPPDLSATQMTAAVRQRMIDVNAALRGDPGAQDLSASTVAILIARGNHFACLWAGDSRIYRLRDGIMTQITHDHSLVQELVDIGEISAEDAELHPNANIITRAVGAEDDMQLDSVTGGLRPNDRFLLCSDGLCKTLPEAMLGRLLAEPADPAAGLIKASLMRRGRDNITAVVVDVLTLDPAP